MSAPRILVYGNAGSGKTTLARELARTLGIAHLDLDNVAWVAAAVRQSPEASLALMLEFSAAHPGWVMEGCYGDLIEMMLPHCTELRFINPGIEVCVAQCRKRPWEPEKYESPEAQDAMLQHLIDWVREYETRTDEYSLARHRAIFDGFAGLKREHRGDVGDSP